MGEPTIDLRHVDSLVSNIASTVKSAPCCPVEKVLYAITGDEIGHGLRLGGEKPNRGGLHVYTAGIETTASTAAPRP